MELWDSPTHAYGDEFIVVGDCVFSDVDGLCLNGLSRRYTLRLPREMLIHDGFWSVTLYDAESMRLSDNKIGRHAVHSHMVPAMTREADGGLAIWLQSSRPGASREANWLPAPVGPFYLVVRIFAPGPQYLPPSGGTPAVHRR